MYRAIAWDQHDHRIAFEYFKAGEALRQFLDGYGLRYSDEEYMTTVSIMHAIHFAQEEEALS